MSHDPRGKTFKQWRHLWNAGTKRHRPEQLGLLRQRHKDDFVTGKLCAGKPTDTNQKKVLHAHSAERLYHLSHLGIFSHTCTGITMVSTVSSLTTKDNSDKSQDPLNLKIALLTTVNARFSIVNRASQVIYVAMACIRSPPSFSCFPVTCHNESETVVSSNMSYIA